jgi:uncharacterized protein YuzB (UPF0349 family)
MLPVSIFLCLLPNVTVSIFLCLVPNVTRVYLSVSCVLCYPCLSFCVLCSMLLNTRHRKIQMGNIGHKKQNYRHGQHWTQDTKRQTRVTLNTKHRKIDTVQWYPCLSFCVLCPMLPVSIFLCLESNDNRVYLCVSFVQCYIRATLDTRHRKTDTVNIGHKTQKDRHV